MPNKMELPQNTWDEKEEEVMVESEEDSNMESLHTEVAEHKQKEEEQAQGLSSEAHQRLQDLSADLHKRRAGVMKETEKQLKSIRKSLKDKDDVFAGGENGKSKKHINLVKSIKKVERDNIRKQEELEEFDDLEKESKAAVAREMELNFAPEAFADLSSLGLSVEDLARVPDLSSLNTVTQGLIAHRLKTLVNQHNNKASKEIPAKNSLLKRLFNIKLKEQEEDASAHDKYSDTLVKLTEWAKQQDFQEYESGDNKFKIDFLNLLSDEDFTPAQEEALKDFNHAASILAKKPLSPEEDTNDPDWQDFEKLEGMVKEMMTEELLWSEDKASKVLEKARTRLRKVRAIEGE